MVKQGVFRPHTYLPSRSLWFTDPYGGNLDYSSRWAHDTTRGTWGTSLVGSCSVMSAGHLSYLLPSRVITHPRAGGRVGWGEVYSPTLPSLVILTLVVELPSGHSTRRRVPPRRWGYIIHVTCLDPWVLPFGKRLCVTPPQRTVRACCTWART